MPGPFHTLDVICARRQALVYVSSPVCEVDFSSSGDPSIVLSQFRRRLGPRGFTFSIVNGRIRFRWDNTDGGICYSLYRLEDGEFVLVAECIGDCVGEECTFTCDDCGPGTYVVTVILPTGESQVSDAIVIGGFAPECADVGGPPTPIGPDAFEILAEVIWDELIVDQAQFTPVPNFSFLWTQPWPDDYPPGHYDTKYVTGFFDNGTSPPDFRGSTTLAGNADDNFNPNTTFTFVTYIIYEPDPPFTETFAQGINRVGPSYNSVETQMQTYWNGVPRHRWKHLERHENDGGQLLATFQDVSATFDTPFPYRIQLIQVDGLIQQPRQIRVQGWAFAKMNFSPGVQSWDGVFTERLAYEPDELVYVAPPFGAFAGASARYVPTGHPTSPNGAGWIVEIFFAPATPEWTGLKTIDSQALGQYKRTVASPNVPPCIVLEEVPEEP